MKKRADGHLKIKKIKKPKPEKLESIREEDIILRLKSDLDKEEARDISIKEGSYASISQGVGHSYISPFAIALGANNAQIGILSSLPGIISPLSQLRGFRFMEKRSRKEIVREHVFLEAMMWLLILILAILGMNNILKIELPFLLIILYSLLIYIGGLSFPSWFSWMGDIVSEKSRARYFSKRNRITGTVALISMLIASFFLDYLKTKGLTLAGFAILFLIANLARLRSCNLFKKQHEPELKLKKGYYYPLKHFITSLPKSNLGKFVIFNLLLNFARFIAAPFFAVYMLRDLGLSYTWFTAITITGTIFTLLSLTLWGKFTDKYGSRTTLKIGSSLIPLIPILWLFSKNPIYLMLVPGLIGGLGWAAFNISSTSFIYDSTTREKRAMFIAYHNIVTGLGLILGGLLGSLLAQKLTIGFMNIILFIFLLSGILRALVCLIMIPQIKEVRKVKKTKKLVRAILKEVKTIHQHQGVHHEPIYFKHSYPITIGVKK